MHIEYYHSKKQKITCIINEEKIVIQLHMHICKNKIEYANDYNSIVQDVQAFFVEQAHQIFFTRSNFEPGGNL